MGVAVGRVDDLAGGDIAAWRSENVASGFARDATDARALVQLRAMLLSGAGEAEQPFQRVQAAAARLPPRAEVTRARDTGHHLVLADPIDARDAEGLHQLHFLPDARDV